VSISAELREQVRQRANLACEYCGVTETDTAGQLTIDHFHPQAWGGRDTLLYAVTVTGRFTLQRLRLNRPPLVAHRLRRRQSAEEQRLLTRLRDVTALLEQLYAQHAALLEENRALLQEQRRVLQLLRDQQKSGNG